MAENEKQQEQNEKEKKIIIDENWKKEARKEKETLDEQEEIQKEKPQEKPQARGPLPKGDFAALISMLVTQSLYALGAILVKGQDEQEKEPDFELARYNIDMLETIQEKTKGNLSEEEAKMIENTLSQVRMTYVTVAKKAGKK